MVRQPKNTWVLIVAFLGFALLTSARSQDSSTEVYPIKGIGFATDGVESKFLSDEGYYYLARQSFTNMPLPEILADTNDVDGGWGTAIDGFEVSLRFRQTEFLSNEPVMAVIILRNLRPNPATIMVSDSMWKFSLNDGTNNCSWIRPVSHGASNLSPDNGVSAFTMAGHSEGILVARLNRFFRMARIGDYSAQVEMFVPGMGGRKSVSVISSKVPFRIVETLSPVESARIRLRNETIHAALSKFGQPGAY